MSQIQTSTPIHLPPNSTPLTLLLSPTTLPHTTHIQYKPNAKVIRTKTHTAIQPNASVHTAKYGIGIMKEGVVTITPVHILMTRRETTVTTAAVEDAEETEEEREEENNKMEWESTIQRRFAGSREEVNENVERRKREEEEDWIELKREEATSAQALEYYHQLTTTDPQILKTATTKESYLRSISTASQNTSQAEADNASSPLVALMKSAKIITWAKLRTLLPQYSEAKLLTDLVRVATLCRHVWVAREALLFKPENVRPRSAYTHLIHLFSENEYVTRHDFNKIVRLTPPRDKEVLSQIATIRGELGWSLKHTANEDEWCSGVAADIKTIMVKARQSWEREWETAAVKLGILEGKVTIQKKIQYLLVILLIQYYALMLIASILRVWCYGVGRVISARNRLNMFVL